MYFKSIRIEAWAKYGRIDLDSHIVAFQALSDHHSENYEHKDCAIGRHEVEKLKRLGFVV